MQCKCGYRFSAPENRSRVRDGFAVIRNADYSRFLKSEMSAMEAPDRETKLAALGRSAAYVGSAHICPECGRLMLLRPLRRGKWSIEFYQMEQKGRTESRSFRDAKTISNDSTGIPGGQSGLGSA